MPDLLIKNGIEIGGLLVLYRISTSKQNHMTENVPVLQ